MEEDMFEQWFLANGGYINPNIEITKDQITGRYLRVLDGEALGAGSLIISCPHELTISWLNVIKGSETFLGQFDLGDMYHAVNEVVIVRFFVMNEYIKGEDSFWWPYIRSLPQPTDAQLLGTPLYYDDEDWLWLRGTNLEHAATKTERMWYNEYDEVMQSLVRIEGSLANDWSWSLYKWAATIMSSRCFPASALANSILAERSSGSHGTPAGIPGDAIEPGSPVLIPGIDLLNHRPSAKVTWQWTSINCRLVINENLGAGTPICNNYGQKSNEERKRMPSSRLPASLHGLDSQVTQPTRKPERASESQVEAALEARRETVHWVRLRNSFIDKIPQDAPPSYEFSPGFLNGVATALCNLREKTAGHPHLQGQIDFANPDMSRNKLKVLAAATMLLQRQLSNIVDHNANLPQWPDNIRQFHAARYRRGQLHILRTVNASLLGRLSGLVGDSSARDFRVVRLEHMLAEAPSPLLTDFRAALNAGLGTRKASKIRERGWVECAFTLWVCGVWLWGQGLESRSATGGLDLQSRMVQWLGFLRRAYKDDEAVTGPADEQLAESYLGVIQAAVQKNPRSVYGSGACTLARMRWCLNVVREESVMCPSFEGRAGDEHDELVLFFEC
ncbi:MAG: hypothetical protein Q9195_003824 [Heterodermia aff. obscurata]